MESSPPDSRTTANFPLWATIAPRYASRRVSASRAHSMTGADPTPFQRKGEGRAVGDPLRLDLHQPGRRSAERRVGKEGVRTCRSRWSPCPHKNKHKKKQDDNQE